MTLGCIPAFRRLRQADSPAFKASLNYNVSAKPASCESGGTLLAVSLVWLLKVPEDRVSGLGRRVRERRVLLVLSL